jgi:hypothetical protein
VTLRQYAENDWLAHIKTKVREKTAEEYLNDILIPRVFPCLRDIALKDIRPKYLDHFAGHLKTLTWHWSLPIGTGDRRQIAKPEAHQHFFVAGAPNP